MNFCEVSVFLDDLPRGGARRAPELQHVPAHLVGQAEDAGDDRVGGARRATTGSGAAAEDQTPQPQHASARLPSIRGPRAARCADVSDELLTSDPVLIENQLRPSALVGCKHAFRRIVLISCIQRRARPKKSENDLRVCSCRIRF